MNLHILIGCAVVSMQFATSGRTENGHVILPADPLMRGIYFASKRYPERAVTEFKRCTSLRAASPRQLIIVSQAYLDVGDTQSSLATIAYALSQERVRCEKNESAVLIGLRGSIFSSMNRLDEAASAYGQAAALSPELSSQFLSRAGQQYMKDRKYREALPFLEKGLRPGAMNGFVYQDLGHCYLELKLSAKAVAPLIASIESFEAFRKKQSEAYLPGLIQSHKYLVQAYEEVGNRKQASLWRARLDKLVCDLNKDFFGN